MYILNRIISKSISMIPYELWTSGKPSLDYFKIWGSSSIYRYQVIKEVNLMLKA